MNTLYCVMAWPDGGYAEMMVGAFITLAEAEECIKNKEAKYPKWRFRIAEHESTVG